MITKLLMVFLCIVAGVMGGLALSKRVSLRQRYFEELCNLIDRLISDIKFSQQRIEQIITASECKYITQNVEEYRQFLSGEELNLSRGVLTNRELDILRDFFLRLGTLDLDTQINELNLKKEEFLRLKEQASSKNKRFGAAFVKLGFLAGLLVGILLL